MKKSAPEFVKLNPPEKERIYTFSEGNQIVLKNITHFATSKTTHRLKTKDGKLHIVPSQGWVHIEIDAKKFTI